MMAMQESSPALYLYQPVEHTEKSMYQTLIYQAEYSVPGSSPLVVSLNPLNNHCNAYSSASALRVSSSFSWLASLLSAAATATLHIQFPDILFFSLVFFFAFFSFEK